ncbi:3-keto-disaccharide hydrolase [Tundrisphaera lichenicola]|uniref:3-keto-disaccharide hydrolase n=1 Tax=Tundrisphaera lichenicola TaxID=2029860 RepID=UPI003EB924B8
MLLRPLGLIVAGCLIASVARADTGFVPMFDGKTLDGWEVVGGGAKYRVENGEIVGEVDPTSRMNTFLRTKKSYGDFVLKVDLKLDLLANSGIQFRSHQRVEKSGIRVFGYQAEVDPSARAWSGGIYDEARRGWIFDLKDRPEAQAAFKVDDWNSYTIEAIGPHLKVSVNGVPCADLLDAMDLEGFIALQVHVSNQPGTIRWRNVQIEDLGQSRWKSLWDGKTLDGWRTTGGGRWTVENGAIQGTQSSSESRHGHLVSDGEFGDFAFRLKFQSKKGNSGLYFRVEEGGTYGVRGFQAEIDPTADVGGIYETDGRGWVVQPAPADVKKWLKTEGWNELVVIALGDRVLVQVNGNKSAEIVDPMGRRRGKFALQLHGGQDVDVLFKDLEILPISQGK